MGELSRIAAQIKHYRELAHIASDCAGKNTTHRAEYLELAKQWTALADRLENGDPDSEDAGPSNMHVYEAKADPKGH